VNPVRTPAARTAPAPGPGDRDPRLTDPRLTDPDAARVGAERAARTAHLVPQHRAGLAVARARARGRVTAPDDDDLLVVREVTVRGAAGPLPARTYTPAGRARATVLHLHGGGWALGDVGTDDVVCRRLAADARVVVLDLGYRLAPEHPFPAALHDAAAVLDDLADGRVPGCPGPADGPVDGVPLAVAGLGTGGALAAALVRRSRDGAAPPLAHQLLLCPVLDCDLTRPSYGEFGDGLGLTADDMAWFWSMYVPDRAARRHPEVSPLRWPDLSGLPATALVVAGADPLRDEGNAYAGRLRAAGVAVLHDLVEGVPHGFVAVPGIGSGREALRRSTDHLVRTLDDLARGGPGPGAGRVPAVPGSSSSHRAEAGTRP